MHAYASSYPLFQYRRRRAFFWSRTAQHVRTPLLARELARATLALAGLVTWGALIFLIAG